MISSSILVVALLSAPTIYLLLRLQTWLEDRKKLPLPPQPAGVPFLGNALDVIKSTKTGSQHLLFEKYARSCGEIVRVQVGPFTQYFINSDEAVKAIFDKASATTSERPRWIVSNEQICDQKNVLLLNASHLRWKQQRKVILQGMTSVPRADAGIEYLHFETAKFLKQVANDYDLASDSVGLFNEIGRYTYSAFASQTFGMDIPDEKDPAIEYIYRSGLEQILGTLPGSHLVDILPVLDRLPLFFKPWEKKARALFQDNKKWCDERKRRVEDSIKAGTVNDSFLARVLQDEKSMGFSDRSEAAYLALMLIMGAADTSKMSSWSFLEAMMRFPDVQAKALAEIEAVVGVAQRLPVYEDLESIPYVRYLMKELWRWRPPVALGHPHIVTKELTYNGVRLPAGSRIHLNAWAIGHDPNRHADPERFWPERYEGDLTTSEQSKNSADVKDRDHFAFGSGRRICPGYHVAERSLAIAIMRLVWAFEIVPAPNAKLPLDPRDYPGEMPGNPGEHMPVLLKVRSEAKRKAIDEEYVKAEAAHPAMEPLTHDGWSWRF
ncbi:cytochrome P450 [Didymella exigua CBS 183.55]|uniref:Cytochrome P450 n=1 Tax=Didymella exigua CBS 183.55 TaxID=1150837 RepID=A0A6A5RJJ6_9PLEO|nr:cytochrome P450 [Didymella exigua CBS 183.55]KAF1927809.1 cytochrome P450 [Didymella exigua CBS 183.55]